VNTLICLEPKKEILVIAILIGAFKNLWNDDLLLAQCQWSDSEAVIRAGDSTEIVSSLSRSTILRNLCPNESVVSLLSRYFLLNSGLLHGVLPQWSFPIRQRFSSRHQVRLVLTVCQWLKLRPLDRSGSAAHYFSVFFCGVLLIGGGCTGWVLPVKAGHLQGVLS